MKRTIMTLWGPRAAPRGLMLAGGVGGALLGLPYVLRAFGPTEAEVVGWGWVSLALGAVLLLARLAMRARDDALPPVAVALIAAVCGALAFLQAPPALLWVLFHGQPIGDGSPPSVFVAHWMMALPHAAVAGVALAAICRLLRPRRGMAAATFAEVLARQRPPDATPPA